MVRSFTICSMLFACLGTNAQAQLSIFAGSVFATAEISEDGMLEINQSYTVMAPQTRTRTESYTVMVPTADGGAKPEIRTREVGYTVMVPKTQRRGVRVADYRVEFKTGKEIEKERFIASMKKLSKPRPVLVLGEKQRISELERSMLNSKVLVIKSKSGSFPGIEPAVGRAIPPTAIPPTAILPLGEEDDPFDTDADAESGGDSESADDEQDPFG